MRGVIPAAALAVVVACLILGIALIALSKKMTERAHADMLFLQGLMFIALGVLIAFVLRAFEGGLS